MQPALVVGVASEAVDCKTEWEPVTPGSESIKAKSIKPAAAPIVIFERILAVPRGPNAVLDTLLEKQIAGAGFARLQQHYDNQNNARQNK